MKTPQNQFSSSFQFPLLPNFSYPSINHPYDPSQAQSFWTCTRLLQTQNLQIERGKWSVKEQKLYVRFLEDNTLDIKTKLSRKATKIFKKMSQVIKTRTADQCRSHHQKILNYHGEVEEIIGFYQNLFNKGYHRQPPEKSQLPLTSPEDTKTDFYSVTRSQNGFRIEIRESAIACCKF